MANCSINTHLSAGGTMANYTINIHLSGDDEILTFHSGKSFWVELGNVGIFPNYPEVARKIAGGFNKLADMMEAGGLKNGL